MVLLRKLDGLSIDVSYSLILKTTKNKTGVEISSVYLL